MYISRLLLFCCFVCFRFSAIVSSSSRNLNYKAYDLRKENNTIVVIKTMCFFVMYAVYLTEGRSVVYRGTKL